jgi:uncharacterized membrane protein YidH (DUF202 family)
LERSENAAETQAIQKLESSCKTYCIESPHILVRQKNMLIYTLIIACVGYVVLAIVSAMRSRHEEKRDYDQVISHVFAGVIPVIVVCIMTYLFLVVRVASTAQFNAWSASHMNVWSIWVNIWPGFLLLSFLSGLVTLVWAFVCIVKKKLRHKIPILISSFILSVLTLVTVMSYFPSA